MPNWAATADKFPLHLSIALRIMTISMSSNVSTADSCTGIFFGK